MVPAENIGFLRPLNGGLRLGEGRPNFIWTRHRGCQR